MKHLGDITKLNGAVGIGDRRVPHCCDETEIP